MTEYSEYINDFISGTLPPDKMKEFQAKLAIDKELHEEYQILLRSREYIKARSMLEEIENDPYLEEAEELVRLHFDESEANPGDISCTIPDTTAKSVPSFRKIAFIIFPAAAVLAGVFIVFRFFLPIDPYQLLYNHYYDPLKREVMELELVRGTSSRYFYPGMECYLNKDYECAIEHFSQIRESKYFLGLAYLGKEEPDQAMHYLEEFQKENPNHPGVNWYLGLIHVSLQNLNQAKQYLNNLLIRENHYKPDAEKILHRIEKLIAAERK